MIYSTGKIGVAEGMSLVTMLLLPNIYLSEPSISIGFVGSPAWLLKIMSGSLAIMFMLVILQFYQSYTTKFNGGKLISFFEFTQGLIGKKLAVIMFIIWAILFQLDTILTLRQLADYTLITSLPNTTIPIIMFVFAITISLVIFQGLEVILRTAYIFFIVSAFGIIMAMLGLGRIMDFSYLFPWQGYGLDNLAKYSILDMGNWLSAVAVLIVAPNLQKISTIRKSIVYGIGYTILLKALLLAFIVMIFDILITPERALLFFESVQAIHLSHYLHRVDAVFIIIWLTGGIVSTMLLQFFTLTLICQPFKFDDMRPLIPIGVLISASIALLPNGFADVIKLNMNFGYYMCSFFMLFSLIVLSIGYFLRCRRNKSCIGAME